jgi:hypothetical protein
VSLGPVQLLVIAVEDDDLGHGIVARLSRLADNETVGLIDFLLVTRDAAGAISSVPQEISILGLGGDAGTLVTALLGVEADAGDDTFADCGRETVATMDGSLGNEAGGWFLADAIPPSTTAAIVLVEHRWAIPLRDLGAEVGGRGLIDRWVHPRDLAAIGVDRRRSA